MYANESSCMNGTSVHVKTMCMKLQRFCYGFSGAKTFGSLIRETGPDLEICVEIPHIGNSKLNFLTADSLET